MKNVFFVLALLLSCLGIVQAQTNITASMTTAQIQTALTANSPGTPVNFAAGSYALTATLNFPCTGGTVYSGPNVGVVTITNPATAVVSGPNISSYSFNVPTNGTGFASPTAGCTFQYFKFTGQHGGIYVHYPSSGITMRENYFTLNDASILNTGSSNALQNIHFDGTFSSSASNGISYATVDSNVFYNQCATVRARVFPDSGGLCAAVWWQGFNNHLTIINNVVNLIEEGFKAPPSGSVLNVLNNIDVENNNMQGNSRILIEVQQDTNGSAVYSHNSFYQPNDPSYNTFELSLPDPGSTSPATTDWDNVFIGNVAPTASGSGSRYGIGLEAWGAGANGQYNLFQGMNGTPSCVGTGGLCESWVLDMGGPNTGQVWINNTIQGVETFNGTANNTGKWAQIEDGAALANATLAPNTVVSTAAVIQVSPPVISPGTTSVAIAPPDSNHRYSIFYTVDGSTPSIFGPGGSSGTTALYTVPFTPVSGATIKAIAAWGAGANQGIIFPSFGYSSSVVVSAVYSGSGGSVTLSSIAVTGTNSLIAGGTTSQLTATGTYSNSTTGSVTSTSVWTSDNTAACTVTSTDGLVTPVAAGTCNIQATVGAVSSANYSITVSAATLVSTSLSTVPVNGVNTMNVGGTTITFQTIGLFSNGTSSPVSATSWASSDPTKCTVDSSTGIVTAVAVGTCNITSVSGGKTSSYWTVTVNPAASLVSMSIAASASTVLVGQPLLFTANGVFTSGPSQTVSPGSYTSSAPNIGSVDNSGNFVALSAGTTNITALLGAIQSPAFTVTVNAPSPTLMSLAISPSVAYSTTVFSIAAVGTYSDQSINQVAASWSSSNPNVATVDNNGNVTPVGTGTAYITATVGPLTALATVAVPSTTLFTNPVKPGTFPFSEGNFGCFIFQSLTPGTFTLVVNSDGSFTITQ